MRVIGFAGWSGAGKTTLIVKLIPLLRARGLAVSTLKHAHHNFDIDKPGKDSWAHREAGATEVLVSSANRWALTHELRGAPEPGLAELLRLLGPVDLVLVEGFKTEPHAKIEIYRAADGKPFLHIHDETIVALVSDLADEASTRLPHVGLDDIEKIGDLLMTVARPLDETLATLENAHTRITEKD